MSSAWRLSPVLLMKIWFSQSCWLVLVGHLLNWALRRLSLKILSVLQCQAALLAALLMQVESCRAWGVFLAKAGKP